MIEQKECRLEVTMCHKMRQKSENIFHGIRRDKGAREGLVCLSEGVYAVIPEVAPQICQILSLGYSTMSFVYFSNTAFDPGVLSSAEVVVTGWGFLADNLPFEVISDTLVDGMMQGKVAKRLCKVQFLELNEVSKGQITHLISLKEIMVMQ